MRQLTVVVSLFCSLLSTYAISQVQQKPLSNDDIVALISLGLSDDVVIEKIRSAPATNFDTGLEAIKVLKAATVSDAVLKAMISPHGLSGIGSGRVLDEMSTKFQMLRNGVVTVWSEFGHGTGFIISKDGMILTNSTSSGPPSTSHSSSINDARSRPSCLPPTPNVTSRYSGVI